MLKTSGKEIEAVKRALTEGKHILKIPASRYVGTSAQKKQLLKLAFTQTVAKLLGVKVNENISCIMDGHEDGTPSMVINEKGYFHCFGCMEAGRNLDVFDIMSAIENIRFVDAFRQVEELYVMQAEGTKTGGWPSAMRRTLHNGYYTDVRGDSAAEQFLEGRGISIETAEAYGLRAWEFKGAVYIVLPCDNGAVVRRKIANTAEGAVLPKWINGQGEGGYFNERACGLTDEVIFITEGALDALAVIECGFQAVALNSVTKINTFLRTHEHPLFCILLDNDAEGVAQASTVQEVSGYVVRYGLDVVTLIPFKDVGEAFANKSEQVKVVLQQLAEATREHRRRLNQNISQSGFGGGLA